MRATDDERGALDDCGRGATGRSPNRRSTMQREIRPRESVTEVVVRTVVEQTDTEPTVPRHLGDSIDPDAIEALFDGASGNGDRSLRLEYEGCRVTIDPETVTVEDAPRPLE